MGKRRHDGAAAAAEAAQPGKKPKHADKAKKADKPLSDAAAATAAAIAATVPIGRPLKSPRWNNRQRTLIFSSRGVSYRARHLMTDVGGLELWRGAAAGFPQPHAHGRCSSAR